jgi:hypothetical protein
MSKSLLAIKVERRAIAIAIFRNHVLRYAEALNLSSSVEMAKHSAKDFVVRYLHRFDIYSAILEDSHADDEARSAELLDNVEQTLLAEGTPTKRIGKQTVFEAYSIVPLASRRELHEVLRSFWPQLHTMDFPRAVMDAAAVGLYEDTEMQLSG